MTFATGLSLFVTMLALASIPSASVVLVVTRSATQGTANGASVAAGIVAGDLIFVALAILGLSALAQSLGAFFTVVKLLGGGYLIWLGIRLLRSPRTVELSTSDTGSANLLVSFTSGLLLTLGDLKAILFYASLLPTFVDMSDLRSSAIVSIALITIAAVGGVKLAYAFAAQRIATRFRNRGATRAVRITGGGAMIGAGAYLLAKT